jgi:hypothetical protein
MPGLAPSVKNQSRTTGPNMTVWMGRTIATLEEVDAKTCNITDANADQDKTGTFASGWSDAEQGNDIWNISMEVINHVNTPLLLGGDKVWVVRKKVAGRSTKTAYFLMNSIVEDTEAAGDDKITMSGRSITRVEGLERIFPTEVLWTPEDEEPTP